MTEDEIIRLAKSLSGTVVLTADGASGAPEVAWGDSFVFYDPDDREENRQLGFATIVTKDYGGFDEASNLNRPGVFRLNLSVGRQQFEAVLGYSPAEHASRAATIDYTALDHVLPHPIYAAQGWVAIVCPSERTDEQARALLKHAHQRAMAQHRAPA
jgi:hypothetical protein